MPESLLTILKFCFLALLYLFLFRVVRAVWAEVKGLPRAAVMAPGPARQRRERARSDRGGAGRGDTHLRVLEPPERRRRTYDPGGDLTLGRAAGWQITRED